MKGKLQATAYDLVLFSQIGKVGSCFHVITIEPKSDHFNLASVTRCTVQLYGLVRTMFRLNKYILVLNCFARLYR